MIHRGRRLCLTALASLALALALAPTALAQNSSVETYGGSGGNVQANVQSGAAGGPSGPTVAGAGTSRAPSAQSSGSGLLPFTGTELGFALAGSVVLLASGVLLARLASRSASAPGSEGTERS
jgi:hypothetical protein